jgi:hypothetical protein
MIHKLIIISFFFIISFSTLFAQSKFDRIALVLNPISTNDSINDTETITNLFLKFGAFEKIYYVTNFELNQIVLNKTNLSYSINRNNKFNLNRFSFIEIMSKIEKDSPTTLVMYYNGKIEKVNSKTNLSLGFKSDRDEEVIKLNEIFKVFNKIHQVSIILHSEKDLKGSFENVSNFWSKKKWSFKPKVKYNPIDENILKQSSYSINQFNSLRVLVLEKINQNGKNPIISAFGGDFFETNIENYISFDRLLEHLNKIHYENNKDYIAREIVVSKKLKNDIILSYGNPNNIIKLINLDNFQFELFPFKLQNIINIEDNQRYSIKKIFNKKDQIQSLTTFNEILNNETFKLDKTNSFYFKLNHDLNLNNHFTFSYSNNQMNLERKQLFEFKVKPTIHQQQNRIDYIGIEHTSNTNPDHFYVQKIIGWDGVLDSVTYFDKNFNMTKKILKNETISNYTYTLEYLDNQLHKVDYKNLYHKQIVFYDSFCLDIKQLRISKGEKNCISTKGFKKADGSIGIDEHNVSNYKYTYNENGDLISEERQFLRDQDEIKSLYIFTKYDSVNRIKEKSFYEFDHTSSELRPVLIEDNYHKIKYSYGENSLECIQLNLKIIENEVPCIETKTYYGLEDNEIDNYLGIHIEKFTYDTFYKDKFVIESYNKDLKLKTINHTGEIILKDSKFRTIYYNQINNKNDHFYSPKKEIYRYQQNQLVLYQKYTIKNSNEYLEESEEFKLNKENEIEQKILFNGPLNQFTMFSYVIDKIENSKQEIQSIIIDNKVYNQNKKKFFYNSINKIVKEENYLYVDNKEKLNNYTTYQYNNYNLIQKISYYSKVNNVIVNTKSKIFVYDNLNKLIEETDYKINNDKESLVLKKIFQYSDDQLTRETHSIKENHLDKIIYRKEYDFNQNKQIVKMVEYTKNNEITKVLNEVRIKYNTENQIEYKIQYSLENKQEIIENYFNDNNLISKIIINYKDELRQEIESSVLYKYNLKGLTILELFQKLSKGTIKIIYKKEWIYNESENSITELFYDYTNSKKKLLNKIIKNYNKDNQIVQQKNYSLDQNKLKIQSKTKYVYNSNKMLSNLEHYSIKNKMEYLDYKYSYKYNQQNVLLSELIESYDGENNYKTHLEYTDEYSILQENHIENLSKELNKYQIDYYKFKTTNANEYYQKLINELNSRNYSIFPNELYYSIQYLHQNFLKNKEKFITKEEIIDSTSGLQLEKNYLFLKNPRFDENYKYFKVELDELHRPKSYRFY